MKVVANNRVHEVTNVDELEAILMRRHDNSASSFWLAHGVEEYPVLSLLVKDDLATLNFMPKEFDAGFASVGSKTALTPGDTTIFPISNNRADDVVVLNDAVLPFSIALQAAREFFFTKDLPKSLEWKQL